MEDFMICCLCLTEDQPAKDIFADEESETAHQIYLISGVKIEKNAYPTGVCIECIECIDVCLKFQRKVQASIANLKIYYASVKKDEARHPHLIDGLAIIETIYDTNTTYLDSVSSTAITNLLDCVHCGKNFSSRSALVKHFRSLKEHEHPSGSPKEKIKRKSSYQCTVCHKIFANSTFLDNHTLHCMKNETVQQHICIEFIDQRLDPEDSKKITPTKENSINMFKCDQCEQHYGSIFFLDKHKLKHQNKK